MKTRGVKTTGVGENHRGENAVAQPASTTVLKNWLDKFSKFYAIKSIAIGGSLTTSTSHKLQHRRGNST